MKSAQHGYGRINKCFWEEVRKALGGGLKSSRVWEPRRKDIVQMFGMCQNVIDWELRRLEDTRLIQGTARNSGYVESAGYMVGNRAGKVRRSPFLRHLKSLAQDCGW
jgi:hypothetical protein